MLFGFRFWLRPVSGRRGGLRLKFCPGAVSPSLGSAFPFFFVTFFRFSAFQCFRFFPSPPPPATSYTLPHYFSAFQLFSLSAFSLLTRYQLGVTYFFRICPRLRLTLSPPSAPAQLFSVSAFSLLPRHQLPVTRYQLLLPWLLPPSPRSCRPAGYLGQAPPRSPLRRWSAFQLFSVSAFRLSAFPLFHSLRPQRLQKHPRRPRIEFPFNLPMRRQAHLAPAMAHS